MESRRHDPLLEGAIGEAAAAFLGALNRGDAHGAAAAYAEDAMLLPPSAELMHGRAAIEAFWQAGLDAGISDAERETVVLQRRDGVAYEIGRYALRLQPPDGDDVIDRGRYMLVRRRQDDGSWLTVVEMFGPDGPPDTAPERGSGPERSQS